MDAKNTYRRAAQWLLGAGVVLAMAGCSNPTTETVLPAATQKPAPAKTLFTIGYVLEDTKHGPELCGAVATSLPPQCGGMPITNWSWDKIPTKESRDGTTWASGYALVGTWADGKFTLTQDPVPEADYTGPRPEPTPDLRDDLEPGCAGAGTAWAKTNYPDWHPQAVEVATAASYYPDQPDGSTQNGLPHAPVIPGFVDSWTTPLDPNTGSADVVKKSGSSYGVLTVSVSGDVAAAEKQLKKQFPGPFCVVQARKTRAELEKIQMEVYDVLKNDPQLANYHGVTSGVEGGFVYFSVLYDDGAVQKALNEKYGPGIVRVTSSELHPMPVK